jgi:hypothetical protein
MAINSLAMDGLSWLGKKGVVAQLDRASAS